MARGRSQSRGAVTISDVAKEVGVATSTVSRALTQPGRVSEEMRLRVLAVSTELGYHANPQARSLTSGRTQSVALLVPDITNPYFFDLIRGMQAQAKAYGYRHLLVDTEESADVEATTLAELPLSVDGIVVAASRLSDEELSTLGQRVPLVAVNREIPGMSSVIINTPDGIVQAIDHLVSLGHQSIAYLGGPVTSWSSRERWLSLEKAAQKLGVDVQRLGPFAPTMHAGAAAAESAVHHDVTACIFFNDILAIGALKRFAERGIRVPQDMSVVGCDDVFGADFCSPPLTTLTAPIERAGRVATDMLIAILRQGGPGHNVPQRCEKLSTYLTIRASTGAVSDRA